MQSESNTDLRLHPLDPRRFGPEGVTAQLVNTFVAFATDVEVRQAFSNLGQALRSDGYGTSYGISQAS